MSKAARQRSARERLAEERRRQAKQQQRVRALMIGLSAVVIIAIVVVVAVVVRNNQTSRAQKASGYTGQLAPVSRQQDGSILMGQPQAKAPKLEIFEDFQCPICKEFESTSGGTIKQLAAQGKVNVTYVPFWLFKQREDPIRRNSLHAANAALCAPADKWVSYHDTLYKYQPEEGSKGFSDKDLIGWAKDLGFDTPAFEKCVTGLQKQSVVEQMTNYATQTRGVSGTPTVYLDGQSLDLQNTLLRPDNLKKAILAAKPVAAPSSGSASSSPSVSVSPSATPKK